MAPPLVVKPSPQHPAPFLAASFSSSVMCCYSYRNSMSSRKDLWSIVCHALDANDAEEILVCGATAAFGSCFDVCGCVAVVLLWLRLGCDQADRISRGDRDVWRCIPICAVQSTEQCSRM
eukprot:1108-Rhodomonas_salina.2